MFHEQQKSQRFSSQTSFFLLVQKLNPAYWCSRLEAVESRSYEVIVEINCFLPYSFLKLEVQKTFRLHTTNQIKIRIKGVRQSNRISHEQKSAALPLSLLVFHEIVLIAFKTSVTIKQTSSTFKVVNSELYGHD